MEKVILIAPPRYLKDRGVPGYMGFGKNLGLSYIAAVLQENKISVSIVDAYALGIDNFSHIPEKNLFQCGLDFSDIADKIDSNTTYIGITVPFSSMRDIVFSLAIYIKRIHPNIKIVIGGVHPSSFPVESLKDGIDYVIAGEGEFSMLALVKGEPLDTIPGLVWRDKEICRNKKARVKNLDLVPFPAWNLLPMDLYFKRSQRGDGKRTLTLISSRGCPFDCNFCSIHSVSSHLWRARSSENVLKEIEEAYHQYGIQHIEIEDDNFTLDRERALTILRSLKHIGPITWSAHNGVRIDTLDEELLQAVKESGCVQLNIAIEHGSEIVLDQMNKRLSLQKVREVVQECSRLNINAVGFCIVGYPGETREAFIESAEFYKEMKLLGLTCVAPFIVNAYPGTHLYDQAKQNGWLNPKTDNHFFCMEDNFVSVTTPDFDANEVLKRLHVMGMINGNPHVNVAQLV